MLIWPVGGGDGGFRVFRQFPQRSLGEVRCGGAIGFLFDRGYQRLWNITLCHMFLG